MDANFKHIMLVDDDEDDRIIFKIVVADVAPSLIVSTADDGRTALQSLLEPNANLPNLIFLDINMPVMNGFECLKEIKENELLKNIPVIMFSTSCNERDVEKAHHLGASLYIVKPFSIDEYEQLMKKVLSLDLKKVVLSPRDKNYMMEMKSFLWNR